MTKFSIEEKMRAIELVKKGLSLGEAARLTGISWQVIRQFMRQADRHGLSSLQEHRYDWRAEEKFAVLKFMEANHLSCAETSIQFGIKGSSTIWSWAEQYQRYGMAGLEPKKRGRPKKWRPPDETMTREEQLEAENLYLRAENAYLKKLNALVAEQEKPEREHKQQ
jgi:transposase-like protein